MSRVISRVESAVWERWDAPSVALDGLPYDARAKAKLPTEQELEQLRRDAYEEGFASGRADGLAQGRQEIDAQAERLRQLMDALARPFQGLDKQVENELVALATALVRQLLRREIKTEPPVVVAAVRAALEVLPVASRNISVQLHPADAALVRELLPPQEEEQDWRITENPAMTRGGCVVVTDVSHVDATVERRLSTAILNAFGGDRHADPRRSPPEGQGENEPAANTKVDTGGAGPDS
jgi:flagellar assembly protein FliH